MTFAKPKQLKAHGSHHMILRFTDFLVYNLYLQKGFWLAAVELVLRWRDSRNSQRGLYSLH